MELYIHIPFCIRKCAYCDFLSGSADERTQDAYMEALLREVTMAGTMHRQRLLQGMEDPEMVKVDTVFIGGGTPSAVDAEWIVRLMDRIRREFTLAEDAEITMEANPGTLTADKLIRYREAGINRLSMGLQSTDNGELQRLGRIHTYQEFLDNYRLAREAGFTNINIDLMSALPGQTVESYEQTLRRVIALGPEHISAYSLIIEEGTPFWELYGEEDAQPRQEEQQNGKDPLPTEEQDRQMYHLTKEILGQAGYERYEISNYSKPGYECRHNVGYWTRVPYIGLGLGASSYYGGQRFSNHCRMEEYLAGWKDLKEDATTDHWYDLRQDVQTLTDQDAMEEFMFLGLRLIRGISAKQFKEMFDREIQSVFGPVLKRLTEQGLLRETSDGWCFTEWGLDVSNYALAEFLL